MLTRTTPPKSSPKPPPQAWQQRPPDTRPHEVAERLAIQPSVTVDVVSAGLGAAAAAAVTYVVTHQEEVTEFIDKAADNVSRSGRYGGRTDDDLAPRTD